MSSIGAEVILDSINPYNGIRLTTMIIEYPRYIGEQFMKHASLRSNSASSRAIPTKKLIEQVVAEPVTPVQWMYRGKGMQPAGPMSFDDAVYCQEQWLLARDACTDVALKMAERGCAKEIVNRLIQTWMWTKSVVTATEWENFYRLRIAHDAQGDHRVLATAMRDAMAASRPQRRTVHIPFVTEDEREMWNATRSISVATGRLARLSYLNHLGVRDPESDVRLHGDVRDAYHMTPFEHSCFARDGKTRCGPYKGWCQYRHAVDHADNWADADHQPLAPRYITC